MENIVTDGVDAPDAVEDTVKRITVPVSRTFMAEGQVIINERIEFRELDTNELLAVTTKSYVESDEQPAPVSSEDLARQYLEKKEKEREEEKDKEEKVDEPTPVPENTN